MITKKLSHMMHGLAAIIKSSLMFIKGIASSWLIGCLEDASILTIVIAWVICDIISDFLVTPIVEAAKKLGAKLEKTHKTMSLK